MLGLTTLLLTFLVNLLPAIPGESGIYDFMLDQYAFPLQVPNEGILQYLERVSPQLLAYFAGRYNDTAMYDLSPLGCAEFNAGAQFAYPDVFYFSHPTSRNTTGMNLALKPSYLALATVASDPEIDCTAGLACSSADEWRTPHADRLLLRQVVGSERRARTSAQRAQPGARRACGPVLAYAALPALLAPNIDADPVFASRQRRSRATPR